jgi:rhodanese-related sulfurtransferase
MADLKDFIKGAEDALSSLTPIPVIITDESTADDLKNRLEWGEPALTIVDVRDHEKFNQDRITGAVSMPIAQLGELASSALEPKHDIYVYGESDEQSLQAAEMLRGNGFSTVAQIIGGLSAWREVAGPTEGNAQDSSLDPSAFNVVSRLQAEKDVKVAGEAQHTD